MSISQVAKDIKSLKIQGATQIAVAAVLAIAAEIKKNPTKKSLQASAKKLILARETEPALRNAVNYCVANFQKDPLIAKKAIEHFEFAREKIIEIGASRIKNGMTIFTHCHSSTVEKIIIKAHKQGKRVRVHNTETRPKFQGRLTAAAIAKAGIPIDHFVDSAAIEAMRGCDMFLFGCDAITSDGRIINKIGTALMLEVADKYGIPRYSCTDSWKFDPETMKGKDETIEERNAKEVWDRAPKGVKIHNPAFEVCSPDKITGVISELGILKPEALISEIKSAYPWLIS
ncbi:MAG: ribose-1/5-bisphosphate isomerase [uncultured bacterium]|nr:MAG: ribose-1/5-bisphosphate isomerase [uncultured bacterium]OGJ47155.1 MAG: hypothetical protein A2244_04425 [Candidatus Peregrinibacteria bacterium RIFOXYA2_FULL_41_18]OGJ49360.1 MAG: hypothetical protein A2344_03800 [Candidatus Peregrinibacteria bacterium RIFOXYB12_FULL_41_12]OGJ52864.1 MAG: hypothetical protein A2336_02950 [Candidatus Peregrinibacteria bacterium RIFOXYB2_FULL_41_88]OGJ53269.1 MAG: hypothetical protein A2448_04245 [Candidatus Peregrinibacteria bacterium RIFOXYC2_FULL_41_2